MNTKSLTGNHKVLAIILGAAIFAAVGGSFAFAQTAGTNSGATSQATPQIQGSVNLQQLLLSNVHTRFTDAVNTAASAVTNGQVIGGNLAVIQGSVVYDFRVIDSANMYSVVVDAGNGKVLYTSPGHTIELGALGTGHEEMCHYGMGMHKFFGMGGSPWQSQQPTTPTPPTGTQ